MLCARGGWAMGRGVWTGVVRGRADGEGWGHLTTMGEEGMRGWVREWQRVELSHMLGNGEWLWGVACEIRAGGEW